MSLSSGCPAPGTSLANEPVRPAAHPAGRAAEQITDTWLGLLERLDRERAAMNQFSDELHRALTCRRAVTSLEYGILAGILATALFGGIQIFGTALKNKFLQEASYLS